MAAGFRKSLFGFHCDDVIAYLEKNSKAAKEKEEQLQSLANQAKAEQARLQNENDRLQAELKDYREREKELLKREAQAEKMSQAVGKLYLTATVNARSIMDHAAANVEATRREIRKNLEVLESAKEQIETIREGVNGLAGQYNEQADRLCGSLAETTREVNQRDRESREIFDPLKNNLL